MLGVLMLGHIQMAAPVTDPFKQEPKPKDEKQQVCTPSSLVLAC